MKPSDAVSLDKAFDELASLLETKGENELRLTNFDDFVQNIFALSYPQYDFNTWHIRLLSEKIQQTIDNPDKHLVYVLPRYHLKSTIGYAAVIYRMLTSYGDGLYVSYKADLANYHCSHIKAAISSNEMLSSVLIDLRKQSDSGIVYRIGGRGKHIRIFADGIFSVKRGLHTDVLCLTPDTLVRVSGKPLEGNGGGYQPISSIKVGDKVLTHQRRYRTVTQVMTRCVEENMVVLDLDNGQIIRITGNHPVLTKTGWKNADNLSTSDILLKIHFTSGTAIQLQKYGKLSNGTHIKSICKEHYKGLVYNLEVEEDHTYAGKGIIYHNCIADDILGDLQNPMVLTELEKCRRVFDAEFMQIPNQGCPLIVCGTVIDYSDLLFALRNNPQFENMWLPAVNPTPEHEFLWESKFGKEVLEARKESIGWKAFSTEFLLVPVLATNAYITRDQLSNAITRNLDMSTTEQDTVVAGFDLGKKNDPSHISIFKVVEMQDGKQILSQVFQKFLDHWDYVKQADFVKDLIIQYHISKLYYDNTRSEMEDRDLPSRQCIPIVLGSRTGARTKGKFEIAANFSKLVEQNRIKLIDDDRFIAQLTCVTSDLQAPHTAQGHADSFISVCLAVAAYNDYYATDRKMGLSYLGNMQELMNQDAPSTTVDRQKNFDNVCKICGKRTLKQQDEGGVFCQTCFARY